MEKTFKLGIVGFGRIVELVHLPIIKKIPQFEVGGVFDITPKRLELAANRGFKTYEELSVLLDSNVDVILIATPPDSHFSIASEALKKGKHLLIEKPVTLTYEEAQNLAKIKTTAQKEVTVFYNRRFTPDYLFVKNLIHEGRLGEILFVERRHHVNDNGISFGVKSFDPQWRIKQANGGGALMDWGIHLIDQLLQLRMGAIQKVHATIHSLPQSTGNVEDYVQASLILENGILLSFQINFRSNASTPLWIVGGTEGTLVVNSEKEGFILRKRGDTETFQIDKASLTNGMEIYQSLLASLTGTGDLAVTLDEAVNDMKVLEQIRSVSQ